MPKGKECSGVGTRRKWDGMGGVLGCRWGQGKDLSKVRLDSKDGRRAVQIGLSKWSMGECRGPVKSVCGMDQPEVDGGEGRRNEGK